MNLPCVLYADNSQHKMLEDLWLNMGLITHISFYNYSCMVICVESLEFATFLLLGLFLYNCKLVGIFLLLGLLLFSCKLVGIFFLVGPKWVTRRFELLYISRIILSYYIYILVYPLIFVKKNNSEFYMVSTPTLGN